MKGCCHRQIFAMLLGMKTGCKKFVVHILTATPVTIRPSVNISAWFTLINTSDYGAVTTSPRILAFVCLLCLFVCFQPCQKCQTLNQTFTPYKYVLYYQVRGSFQLKEKQEQMTTSWKKIRWFLQNPCEIAVGQDSVKCSLKSQIECPTHKTFSPICSQTHSHQSPRAGCKPAMRH